MRHCTSDDILDIAREAHETNQLRGQQYPHSYVLAAGVHNCGDSVGARGCDHVMTPESSTRDHSCRLRMMHALAATCPSSSSTTD